MCLRYAIKKCPPIFRKDFRGESVGFRVALGWVACEDGAGMRGIEHETDRVECDRCGFLVELDQGSVCPKCGREVVARYAGKLVEVDIAHEGERIGEALDKLERALDRALVGDARGLKVIHGHGASGRGGAIGPRIRGWLRSEAARYGWKVVRDKYNDGATLVWFE